MEPSRNFDLRLSGTLSAVSVEVIDSPAGQTTAPTVMPCTVSPHVLEDLRDSMPGVDLKAVGCALWRCAFGASAVAELWRASRAEVGSAGILRLRLTIDAAELAALPWELLYDETLDRFLALDGQTPVTRFTRLPIPSAPWPQDRPLRLLFTGSSPSDMLTLRVAQEWAGIEQMIAPLVKQGRLDATDPLSEGATLPALLAALRRKVDIWHFAGHGTDSGLIFCKDHNKPNLVDAGELGQMLLGEGVRLAVINACRAGAGGGQAASVAGALQRAGIPSVVAMQANVSDMAADAFAGGFYDAIAVGQDVDQAVTAARKAIWAAGTHEWWTPALFMRTPEGRIWRVPVDVGETEERARELAYLDGVIERYKFWAEKYTPLAGIAEVRVATTEGPRLDLPMLFMPTGFEKLEEHGFGIERRNKRVSVDDLREAVAKYKRLVILGEPGSGKTTTLWRLAYDLAVVAKDNPQAPLPLFVPLGGYSGAESAESYVEGYFEEVGHQLPAYLRNKRVALLLDALNEMPQTNRKVRVERIQALLDQHPDAPVVVTCRALDYEETLKLERLEIEPLDLVGQRQYLRRYLGEHDGEALFWLMAGKDLQTLWNQSRQFITTDALRRDDSLDPKINKAGYNVDQDDWLFVNFFLWVYQTPVNVHSDGLIEAQLRLPSLLELGRNPFMLVMIAQVYAASHGTLPDSRGRMLAAFVDTLLKREEKRCDPVVWPGADPLRHGMVRLAYAMQQAGEHGTAVDVVWAAEHLAQPGVPSDLVAYLCASATLLDISDSQVRFVHQLVQEYFAALALASQLEQGDYLLKHLPKDWTQPCVWEETLILIAEIKQNLTWLIEGLLPVNPVLAARCIGVSGGVRPTQATIQNVRERLVSIMTSRQSPVKQRDAAGVAINSIGDSRPGVGLRPDGLPDIEWVFIPDKNARTGCREFIYGNENEHRTEPDFWIARYLVTCRQFQSFLDASDRDRYLTHEDIAWWMKDEVSEHINRLCEVESWMDHSNHPRNEVSWAEAIAFCHWLTATARMQPELLPFELNRDQDWQIALPTEWQWEKAARGYDGRKYPWGEKYEEGRANILEIDTMAGKHYLHRTSSVGIYPHDMPDDSPYGVADLSGNLSEMCLIDPDNPEHTLDDEGLYYVCRGGSWNDHPLQATTTFRRFDFRFRKSPFVGFRVAVVGTSLLSLH